MTPTELIALIDAYGFTDTEQQVKLDFLNFTVWDICSRAQWPFLEQDITFTWDGTSATPTNFPTSTFKAVKSVVDTSVPRRLYPLRVEEFRSRLGSVSTDQNNPIYYYFVGKSFFVWPVPPTSNTSVVMNYLQRQAELNIASTEADILIPSDHHEVIVHGMLEKLYFQDDDPELAAQAKQNFDIKYAAMFEEAFSRQFDRPDTIEIIDYEDLYS